jgi:hypothetical protein
MVDTPNIPTLIAAAALDLLRRHATQLTFPKTLMLRLSEPM